MPEDQNKNIKKISAGIAKKFGNFVQHVVLGTAELTTISTNHNKNIKLRDVSVRVNPNKKMKCNKKCYNYCEP